MSPGYLVVAVTIPYCSCAGSYLAIANKDNATPPEKLSAVKPEPESVSTMARSTFPPNAGLSRDSNSDVSFVAV